MGTTASVALLLLFIHAFHTVCSAERYYYVSSSAGDDAAAGSLSAPWRTLAKASTLTLGAGDKLLLRRGDLWRAGSGLADGVSNNVGLRIQSANGAVVGAYGNTSLPQPRIEVLNAANWTSCIELSDCNATTIRGLSMAGCGRGINVQQELISESHNLLFESNFLSDIRGPMDSFQPGPDAGAGWGAAFRLVGPVGATRNLTVRNNMMVRIDTFFYNPGITITGALLESNTMEGCGYNCMSMGGAEGMIVKNNVFLRDTPPKMFIYGTTDIILGSVDGTSAIIDNDFNRRGEATGGPDGCAIDFETSANGVRVDGNVVERSWGAGIMVFGHDTTSHNLSISNNTFVHAGCMDGVRAQTRGDHGGMY